LEAPPTPTFQKPPEPSLNTPSTDESSSLLAPPPSVKLKVKPPSSEEEAFKRIKDYKIFKQILPPGAAPRDMEKRFFGKYIEKVKPYIENNNEESIEEIINESNIPEKTNQSSTSSNISKNKLKSPKNIETEKKLNIHYKKEGTTVSKPIQAPVISEKLKQEILKKYTTMEEKPLTSKNKEIHLKKYKPLSYNLAILFTFLWSISLAGLIYRRRL